MGTPGALSTVGELGSSILDAGPGRVRDLLRYQAGALLGPRSTWFQSVGMPVSGSTGLPPPHRRPAREAASPRAILTAVSGAVPVLRSAPVATGQSRCVLRSLGAVGRPSLLRASCSSGVRAPLVMLSGVGKWSCILCSRRPRSKEIPHRATHPQKTSGRASDGGMSCGINTCLAALCPAGQPTSGRRFLWSWCLRYPTRSR